MSDGFVDFSFGAGDDALKGGGYTKRFKAETGRTYRVSFAWFTDYDGDGLPVEDSKPKFTGCERTRYKEESALFCLRTQIAPRCWIF